MAQPDPIVVPPRPRSRLGAALLSLLLPGLGQLYAGRPRRAVALFAAFFVYGMAATLCRYGWLPRLWLVVAVLLAGIGISLFAIVDAASGGSAGGARYDRWYIALGLLIAEPLIAVALNAAIAGISTGPGYYAVSSAGMAPTLRPDETLLVDTRYFAGHAPASGDVVAFVTPQQPDTRFIQRIVAVAGDRIEISRGHAIVNGTPADEPYADIGDPGFALNNRPETTVPAGTVYVLGDNRGNSSDSRLFGAVPLGNLVGRATEIVTSSDFGRVGKWVGTPAP